MALAIESDGAITGFSGRSRGVPEIPGSRAAAQRALGALNQPRAAGLEQLFTEDSPSLGDFQADADEHRAQHGACMLGAALDRDGNGWQRFALKCPKGGGAVLALRLDPGNPQRLRELALSDAERGPCAER
jgi:hypothetical protein